MSINTKHRILEGGKGISCIDTGYRIQDTASVNIVKVKKLKKRKKKKKIERDALEGLLNTKYKILSLVFICRENPNWSGISLFPDRPTFCRYIEYSPEVCPKLSRL